MSEAFRQGVELLKQINDKIDKMSTICEDVHDLKTTVYGDEQRGIEGMLPKVERHDTWGKMGAGIIAFVSFLCLWVQAFGLPWHRR